MKIGDNIGKILLEIAQTAIQDGDPQKAIETYTRSLNGFTEEYVIKLLKNEYVLVTNADGASVNMTDWQNERIFNRENITDWDFWLKGKLDEMKATCKALNGIEEQFGKDIGGYILDFDIIAPVREYFGIELANGVGVHNIAAKLIAGEGFANLLSSGEKIWDELCIHVEDDQAKKYEKALYYIVKYVDCIRILHKEYISFAKSSEFLLKNELAQRPLFIESKIESVIYMLHRFSDTSKGYYHPLCNTKLYEYKERIDDDILSTTLGKEYRRYGIIEKNVMDGYDAGWLSPDGKFYGENGAASTMIHLRIAEHIKDGDIDADRELEKGGWLKIHGAEVYGCFIGHTEPSEDFPYAYCPTEKQIKMVCDYIDKFHNGKLYTQPQIVRRTQPIRTYKLRQMDRIMLHDIFGL